jgi:hypothetical protein
MYVNEGTVGLYRVLIKLGCCVLREEVTKISPGLLRVLTVMQLKDQRRPEMLIYECMTWGAKVCLQHINFVIFYSCTGYQ